MGLHTGSAHDACEAELIDITTAVKGRAVRDEAQDLRLEAPLNLMTTISSGSGKNIWTSWKQDFPSGKT